MRGGFVHNRVLVTRVQQALQDVGATTWLEHPTGPASPRGFVDIYATLGDRRLVCEAELRPDRIAEAFSKAIALRADHLLLVVPTERLGRAIRKRIDRLDTVQNGRAPMLLVLPLGQAVHWVRNSFPFLTSRNAWSPELEKKRRHAH